MTKCSKGVVLVNPATSFSRTLWSKIGPVIARLPQPLYTLGMIPIGLLLIDAGQVRQSGRTSVFFLGLFEPRASSLRLHLSLSTLHSTHGQHRSRA